MSQEASTNLIILEPSEELIASEPWTIDTYADGLMDELFADIDTILDGNSSNLPSQMVQPAYSHLQTVRMSQIVLPQTQIQTVQAVPELRNKQINTVVVNTATQGKVVRKRRQKSPSNFGKQFCVAATIGLAIAGIAWTLNSGLLNLLVSNSLEQALEVPQPQLQPQLPTKAEIHADMVNYMLGALALIDSQEAKNNQQSVNIALAPGVIANRTALAYVREQPTTNLPPVVAANNTPPIPSSSSTVVERIYIPVYKAPLPMRYAPPPVSNVASALPPLPQTVNKTAPNTTKPAAAKTAQHNTGKASKPVDVFAAVRPNLKPVDITTAPITVKQPSKPAVPSLPQLVAPPKLPTATAPAPKPAETPKQEVASVTYASTPSHTLEGLLELGDKSAALFQINGVTRRIDIGESIGSSGWTLVDVANGEAIIRRNGEVRSIFTGQKF